MPLERVKLGLGEREIEVRYRAQRDGRFRFAYGRLARIHEWSPQGIDVEIAGRRQAARVTQSQDHLIVQCPRGDLEFVLLPRFVVPGQEGESGGLIAPMPGKVIEIRVAVGDHVEARQTLLLLEAMKMEHPMQATEAGTVSEIRVATGEQVENGALLLVVQPDGDDSSDYTKDDYTTGDETKGDEATSNKRRLELS